MTLVTVLALVIGSAFIALLCLFSLKATKKEVKS